MHNLKLKLINDLYRKQYMESKHILRFCKYVEHIYTMFL